MKEINYFAPELSLIDLDSESVLCASLADGTGDFKIEDYDRVSGNWD